MKRSADLTLLECEKLLGDALAGFAGEIRMIDVIDLIADIHHERHSNLEDLINSAAELSFKSGALKFSRIGHVKIDWGSAATISIWMEFVSELARAHFKLQIESDRAGVQLDFLQTNADAREQQCQTSLFAAALADATLWLPTASIASYQSNALTVESSELAGH